MDFLKFSYTYTEWLLYAAAFLFLVSMYYIVKIWAGLRKYLQNEATKPTALSSAKITWWHLFGNKAVKKNTLMDDHEYDGINEYDNNPPAWFNWLFYVTIVWAIAYMLYFHVFMIGDLPVQAYEKEMAAHEEWLSGRQDLMKIDFNSVIPYTDAERIAEGRNIFAGNCAACHGPSGEGSTGPNLSDDYWIHGGDFTDIVRVVVEGVPSKGMIAWDRLLKPEEILLVSSYIENIKGSNIEGGRSPQGERYSPAKDEQVMLNK